MPFSAIVLARNTSSRFKGKHFKKIGDMYSIEHTINFLYRNKNIQEVYLATGTFKNNFIFKKKLSLIFPKLKFYFHKNESKVVERIFYLSKKIQQKNIVIISGDCPIIDNDFLNRIFNNFKKKSYEISHTITKLQHEGILVTKKSIWSFVNKNSTDKKSQEHPSFFIRSNYKKFKYMKIPYKKQDLYQNIRLSIDTKSDLDFFNIIFLLCKKNSLNFNYKNLLFFKKFKFINSHVSQKQVNFTKKKKIYLITSIDKTYGLGHYNRIKVLKREIIETMSVIPILIKLNSLSQAKSFTKKILKNFNDRRNIFIFDLPKYYLNEFQKIKSVNPKIIIDGKKKIDSDISIIPSFRKLKNFKYSGSKFIILNRDILYEKIKNKIFNNKKKINYLILSGGSFSISKKILLIIKRLCLENLLFILGPLTKKKHEILLQKLNFKYVKHPNNYFELLLNSKKIITRFGTSVNELIALRKKPIIYLYRENKERLKDLKNLVKKNMVTYFKNIRFENNSQKIFHSKPKVYFGALKVINIIRNVYNS